MCLRSGETCSGKDSAQDPGHPSSWIAALEPGLVISFSSFWAYTGGQGITISCSFLIKLSDWLRTLWFLSFLPTRSILGAFFPSGLGGGGGGTFQRGACSRPAAAAGRRRCRRCRVTRRCNGECGPARPHRGRDAGPGPRAVPHHREGRAAAAGLQPPLTAGATGPGEPWPAAVPPRTPPFRAAPPRRFVPGRRPRPVWPPPGHRGRGLPALLVPSLFCSLSRFSPSSAGPESAVFGF